MNTETDTDTPPKVPLRGRPPRKAPLSRPKPDAITHIVAEQAELQQMFTAFENTRSVNNKRFLVARICESVALHAQVTEEIFYPAVQAILPQVVPEHDSLKALAAHIQSLEPVSRHIDGPIQVLANEVRQHVLTLRDNVLAHIKTFDLDLVELGERMARRKTELVASRL